MKKIANLLKFEMTHDKIVKKLLLKREKLSRKEICEKKSFSTKKRREVILIFRF